MQTNEEPGDVHGAGLFWFGISAFAASIPMMCCINSYAEAPSIPLPKLPSILRLFLRRVKRHRLLVMSLRMVACLSVQCRIVFASSCTCMVPNRSAGWRREHY
jgi:hypothetical protein